MHPALSGQERLRSTAAKLEEAIGLAAAINLDVVQAAVAPLLRLRPATFLGEGKVEEIKTLLSHLEPRPGLVVVDAALSPVQHRNLEKAWSAKVLDRTQLILEIFGARAQTAEGRLQVDLAHLSFQKSRLVRSWTHLERQRGGRGFLGGPGERQIESDRRAIGEQIDRLKAKLEDVRRTRSLQRAKRKRAPHPVVALVGYTNAGKSTLFNRLTKADVLAKDLLFATLDPTMRAVDLQSGQRIILSDTVGFISDLPTQLVAAFRATLEEVLEADVIVHIRDVAHPDTEAQRQDVISVLAQLGVTADDERPIVEALNKADLLGAEDRDAATISARHSEIAAAATIDDPVRVVIAAMTGEGVGAFEDLIDRLVTA
ncbi:MAG: GTPase HflX, partial [Parvularculaceae bacterium]|nr:GTPase HflX [Parvularculaceae bacterium]